MATDEIPISDIVRMSVELIETRKKQLLAMVNMYQALGGGWRKSG